VRKNLKRKHLSRGKCRDWPLGLLGRAYSRTEIVVGTHLGNFRRSGKQRAYRIRNLEVCTEYGRRVNRGAGRRGLAGMRSITHEGYYHELHELSNTTVVLVF